MVFFWVFWCSAEPAVVFQSFGLYRGLRVGVGRGRLVRVMSGVFGGDRCVATVLRAVAKLARGMGGGTVRRG